LRFPDANAAFTEDTFPTCKGTLFKIYYYVAHPVGGSEGRYHLEFVYYGEKRFGFLPLVARVARETFFSKAFNLFVIRRNSFSLFRIARSVSLNDAYDRFADIV
jgi:hypothetical protein